MTDFIKRNIPVFIIGLVTIGVFLLIIFVAQKNPAGGPTMEQIEKEQLIQGHNPVKGNPEATVVLLEFSDYQCPACKSFNPVVKSITDKYSSYLKFVYKHFPLPIHEHAKIAATAAQAANAQGMFWEYNEELFEISPALDRDSLISAAERVGLDMEKFKADLDDPKYNNEVAEDNALAARLGLNSTPSFILNNRLLRLTTFDDLEKQVRAEIESTGVSLDGISLGPIVNEVSESTASNNGSAVPTPEQIAIDQKYGTAVIEFDGTFFKPGTLRAVTGQKAKFVNISDREMELEQIMGLYNEFPRQLILNPGDEFEFRIKHKELWTYKDRNYRIYGSIYAAEPEL